MERQRRIGVVGGGPAGLTAAYRLQRLGAEVVVWEAEAWLGGRTRTDRLEGFRVDAGAQLFGSMYTHFFALVREVGLRGELVRSPGRDALWRGGEAHEVEYGSMASMLATRSLPFRTKLRLGSSYLPFLRRHAHALDLHAPERAARVGLDRESIAAWGTRELGREFVEYLAYPQLAAYYGAEPEETSAGLYHVLAHHATEVTVFALRGGAARLCERLAERVREGGGEVRTGAPVERVTREGAGVRVGGAGWEEEVDGVVLAAPAPVSARLLRGAPGPLSEWLTGVRYRPALTLGILLRRPLGVGYFGLSFSARRRGGGGGGVRGGEQGRGAGAAGPRPAGGPHHLGRGGAAAGRAAAGGLRRGAARPAPGVPRAGAGDRAGARLPLARRQPHRLPRLSRAPGRLPGRGDGGGEPLALAGDYLYSSSIEGAVTSGAEAAQRLWGRLGG